MPNTYSTLLPSEVWSRHIFCLLTEDEQLSVAAVSKSWRASFRLWVTSIQPRDLDPHQIIKFPNITTISLHRLKPNQLQLPSNFIFTDSLHTVSLQGTCCRTNQLLQLVDKVPSITALDLSRSSAASDGTLEAIVLQHGRKLRTLRIAENALFTGWTLRSFHQLHQLEHLDMSGCNNLLLNHLACLSQFPRLSHVSIAGFKSWSDVVCHAPQMCKLVDILADAPSLTSLDLHDSSNVLNASVLAHMASSLRGLSQLSIWGCPALALEDVAILNQMPKLRSVAISASWLGTCGHEVALLVRQPWEGPSSAAEAGPTAPPMLRLGMAPRDVCWTIAWPPTTWDPSTSGSEHRSPQPWYAAPMALPQMHTGAPGVDPECIPTLCWSPDSARLALALDSTGPVSLWDALSGSLLRQFGEGGHLGVCWSPDGLWLAAGSLRQGGFVWDVCSGVEVLRLDPGRGLLPVCWTGGGRTLVVLSDGAVSWWECGEGQASPASQVGPAGLGEEGDPATCVALSPDGDRLATGHNGATRTQVWCMHSGRRLLHLRRSRAEVNCLSWSPDGAWLASTIGDHTVRIWDVASGQHAQQWDLRNRAQELHGMLQVNTVCWSPDSRRVASGWSDGGVRVWDVQGGQQLLDMRCAGAVHNVAWSADGAMLAAAVEGGALHGWRLLLPQPQAQPASSE